MNKQAKQDFSRLKAAVRAKAQERLGITKAAENWSVEDIRNFKVDLAETCQSTVSEKWFYTHFKNQSEKLPRQDVLNLLCQYCEYKNWEAFTQQQTLRKILPAGLLGLAAILLLGLGLALFWPSKSRVVVVFTDAYTQRPISAKQLQVKGKASLENGYYFLQQSEKPYHVSGPYYKTREFKVESNEDTLQIELYPDDYALMINYFSRSSTQNWLKRKEQLLEVIHPEAQIFQNHPQLAGIELLNRDEFIDRLILPVNSLKNLEIQDIVYYQEKIYRLRFIQLEN